jgi:PDZ domain-containing protein
VKASTSRWLLLGGGALLAVVVLLLATMPANDYLFVPNSAHPIAGKVEVEGKSGADGPGGIYYVDVTVRKVRWLERLLPFARPDGASLVPAQAVTAPGESFRHRIVQARAEMKHSEQVAAAVALRADGRAVETVPRGVLVEAVALDVPAAKSLSSGDVIVGVDGRKVTTVEQLLHATRALEPGDEVALRLRQDDKVVERTVRTVAAPDDPKRAIIGISVSQDAKIDLPLDVNIDLGNVGGPSAGLPFALQIYQELGHDVDRGQRVAATGEIELDGSVEPVGGIKQKTYGVRSSGADVFLVPAGENAATARRYAGGLRIVPVKSFEQALRVLRTLSQK